MVTCKRFLEATSCAAFWQDIWVNVPTTTLYHPCHALLVSQLYVQDNRDMHSDCYSGHGLPVPGLFTACYQPWLPRLKKLHVSLNPNPHACQSLASAPALL